MISTNFPCKILQPVSTHVHLYSSLFPSHPLFVYIYTIAIPCVTFDNPLYWKDNCNKTSANGELVCVSVLALLVTDDSQLRYPV